MATFGHLDLRLDFAGTRIQSVKSAGINTLRAASDAWHSATRTGIRVAGNGLAVAADPGGPRRDAVIIAAGSDVAA
jgi:hypothetical protein